MVCKVNFNSVDVYEVIVRHFYSSLISHDIKANSTDRNTVIHTNEYVNKHTFMQIFIMYIVTFSFVNI